MKFRKKPVVIDAVRWFPTSGSTFEGYIVKSYMDKVAAHNSAARLDEYGNDLCKYCAMAYHEHGFIETLEGGHIVCPGDWIITGVKGEHYPCKPDIFAHTYELINWDEE